MSMQDKILEVLRRGGPQVSPKIAREVKGEPIITSAYLSELKASGKVKISAMKIGTSPLYYLPGQEKQLALFADRMNPKDRAVFDKLEQLKVLREAQLDLLSKVALRKMKDFAIPLQVSVGGNDEIFWRWYMLEPAETNLIVSSLLQQVGPSKEVQEVSYDKLSTPVTPPTASAQVARDSETKSVPSAASLAAEAPQTKQVAPETSEMKNPWGSEYPPNTTVKGEAQVDSVYPVNTAATQNGIEFEDTMQAHVVEVVNTVEDMSQIPEEVEPAKGQEVIKEEKKESEVQQKIEDVKVEEKVVEKEPAPKKVEEEKVEQKEPETKERKSEKQKSLMDKIKEFLPKQKGKAGKLLPEVESFLSNKNITIESCEVVRKNADLSLQVLVPSTVGKVLFFCKVRQKKRCDEKDISAAYMEAQVSKLPLLFLYTEEISPKAKEFLESGSFDNLLLMKLEEEK